jgi:hypothetical protein
VIRATGGSGVGDPKMNVMGPIAIRQWLRRSRRRLPVIVALIALGGMVSVHHTGPAMAGMDHGIGAEVAMCLAVATAVGAAVVAVAIGVVPWRRPGMTIDLALAAWGIPVSPPPWRARAGPVALQVLRR